MFEENKPDWYKVKTVVPNDWLNQKLETDNYGIYYSVIFEGNVETYLWQSKSEPEVDKKYYGHVHKAKSGKSMRFTKDKEPEGEERPVEAHAWTESPDKQAHISRSVALNNAVALVGAIPTTKEPEEVSATALAIAEEFLAWLNPVSDTEDMESLIASGEALSEDERDIINLSEGENNGGE